MILWLKLAKEDSVQLVMVFWCFSFAASLLLQALSWGRRLLDDYRTSVRIVRQVARSIDGGCHEEVMTFWWPLNLQSKFTCCIHYFCLLPQAPFNSANYQGMLDLPDTDPQAQSELVPVESYPESDMALLIHACAWIYANSINIDSVTHSPIRMSVVEHLVNILSSNCCLPYGFERTWNNTSKGLYTWLV